MGRFESVQGDIWEAERKILTQHAVIKRLKETGYGTCHAERDLQRLEEARVQLKHHRDALRFSLRNNGGR